MAMGKHLVPRPPINFDNSRKRELAVGAGGGCSTFLSRLSFLSPFCLSLGDGSI